MAGKTRFATIFVALPSLLAAGGGAAHYYANGGKLPFAASFARFTATANPGEKQAAEAGGLHISAADLDAVEGAWAGTNGTNDSMSHPARSAQATADSSQIARSAGVVLAQAEMPAKTDSTPTDRYAIPAVVPSPAVVPAGTDPSIYDSTMKNPEDAPASPANAVDAGSPQATANNSEYSAGNRDGISTAAEPEVADEFDHAGSPIATSGSPPSAVTRGQEPNEPAAPSKPDIADQPGANPLRTIPSDANENVAEDDAREAFSDQSPPAAGDRYSNSAAAPRSLDPTAQQTAQTINPFAAKATPGLSSPEAPAAIESVEPILEATGETGSSSGNLVQPSSRNAGMEAGEGTGRPGEHALEGPQQAAMVIQKIAPPEIQVGKTAKLLVKVQNVGSQTAEEVTIHDEVPQGTRLVGSSPTAEVNGSQLVWNIGKLSAGEERTVEVELMPMTEGEVGSVATVSCSAQASAKTRCTMPQLALRLTAPEQVMIGHKQPVKIELHNPGSGDATGVMLFETVPENVRHEAGPTLEFEIGLLRAGETRQLDLSLTAEKAGHVVNVLTARAEGNLQVQQQVEFEVIAPELAVTIEGPGRRYLERPATYQVTVENSGTAPARDVEVITKLPKGMRFVEANNMGQYDAGTHAIYWSLAELPEGERGTVELVAMPVEAGTQTLEVEGRAQQGLTDQTSQPILVEGIASILFEVRDAEDPIEVGGETSYEIRVANQGTKAATNVQIVVGLPAGLQAVSAEGATPHAVQGPGVVFEPLQQLAPRTDTLYRVTVKGAQPGDQRVKVEVKSDDLSQPILREESTRVFGNE